MQDGRGEGHLGQCDSLHRRAALVLGSSSAKLVHMDVEQAAEQASRCLQVKPVSSLRSQDIVRIDELRALS